MNFFDSTFLDTILIIAAYSVTIIYLIKHHNVKKNIIRLENEFSPLNVTYTGKSIKTFYKDTLKENNFYSFLRTHKFAVKGIFFISVLIVILMIFLMIFTILSYFILHNANLIRISTILLLGIIINLFVILEKITNSLWRKVIPFFPPELSNFIEERRLVTIQISKYLKIIYSTWVIFSIVEIIRIVL